MRVACVSVVAPEVVRSPSERPALQPVCIEGSLVGRERELAELARAIDAGARRIWISGASGLGKTELLGQLAIWCRGRGLPYAWIGPHESVTASALRAVVDELSRAAGPSGGRRVLLIDDFARVRPIESWFVERFLPAVASQITVVVADHPAAPPWRTGDPRISLAPLTDADARRVLERRGVAERLHAEIIDAAEGIPALLAAAADAACPPGGRAPACAGATFYARHDSDAHRLAIAVLTIARTTPYELLEATFEETAAARDAFAWLSRLGVVEYTPDGLRPDTVLRKACERELPRHAGALWARARTAVRRFLDHRIALARAPQRWVVDRLFVDREIAGVREHMALPATEPAHAVAPAEPGDHAAVVALADARGDRAGAAIAHLVDDDRTVIDVLRDARGVQGYLCSVALDAGSRAGHRDPVIDLCVAHLRSIGWFGPATPPDARALVVRDWRIAGTQQAPSAGAALVIAQMACRLLTTAGIDHAFVVVDRTEPWQRALGALGLAPRTISDPRLAGLGGGVIAVDLRGCSAAAVLERIVSPAPTTAPLPVPVPAAGSSPLPALPSPAQERSAIDEPAALSSALERRIAQLAKSASLSPREHEVLQLLLLGRNYAEIGTALQITPRTARFHQHNILEKIGAESRHDIVRLLL